ESAPAGQRTDGKSRLGQFLPVYDAVGGVAYLGVVFTGYPDEGGPAESGIFYLLLNRGRVREQVAEISYVIPPGMEVLLALALDQLRGGSEFVKGPARFLYEIMYPLFIGVGQKVGNPIQKILQKNSVLDALAFYFPGNVVLPLVELVSPDFFGPIFPLFLPVL